MVEKRFYVGQKKQLHCDVVITPTDEQFKKLESKDLQKYIENSLKEFKLEMFIEQNDGKRNVVIGRDLGKYADNQAIADLVEDSRQFMCNVDQLELKKEEHGNDCQLAEEDSLLDICKKIVKNADNEETPLCGAVIFASMLGPICVKVGNLSRDALVELCNTYISKYE